MFHDGKSSSDSDILSSFVCIICMNLQVDNYSFKIKLQRIKSPVGHLRGEKILTITIISTEISAKILSVSWKSNFPDIMGGGKVEEINIKAPKA